MSRPRAPIQESAGRKSRLALHPSLPTAVPVSRICLSAPAVRRYRIRAAIARQRLGPHFFFYTDVRHRDRLYLETGIAHARSNQTIQRKNYAMTVFVVPVFDATVVVEGNDLFKGQGSATQWAQRLAAEVGCAVTAKKIGNGWALCGSLDGEDCIWGVYGQRLKRLK
jgi:hypothetical protein